MGQVGRPSDSYCGAGHFLIGPPLPMRCARSPSRDGSRCPRPAIVRHTPASGKGGKNYCFRHVPENRGRRRLLLASERYLGIGSNNLALWPIFLESMGVTEADFIDCETYGWESIDTPLEARRHSIVERVFKRWREEDPADFAALEAANE